jgi:tol-pal system protein YbgF
MLYCIFNFMSGGSMRNLVGGVLAGYCLVAIFFTSAEVVAVEVVEGLPTVSAGSAAGGSNDNSMRQADARGPAATYTTAAQRNESVSAELYVQLQALQVEMSELRGMLEQQSYLIEQISQRRMDDYLDLDQRISGLQASGSVADNKADSAAGQSATARSAPNLSKDVGAAAVAQKTNKGGANGSSAAEASAMQLVPSVRGVVDTDEARSVYSAAYQQVKDRDFSKAKVSLSTFISNYPTSRYVPNAYFWLGELYYLESSLKKSRDAFLALVTQYGDHRKVAEAKFKLGKIYHQLGNDADAKAMLESVLAEHPKSKAVNPAREYLKNSL